MFIFSKNCAWVIFVLLLTTRVHAHNANFEKGTILKTFLDHSTSRGYSYTALSETDATDQQPTYRVSINGPEGGPLMVFDYQSEYNHRHSFVREHIFNLKGAHWPLIERLLAPVFPEELKTSPAARVFLRSIFTSLVQSKLLAMTLATRIQNHRPEPAWASLYLIMVAPKGGSSFHFLPLQESESAPASREQLPLVAVEFHPQSTPTHLHYLRYLVPIHSVERNEDSSSAFGIDLKTAHETLNNFRRFSVTADVGADVTTVFPSLYDGQEIISDVTLEIYALSNYIQGFLDWYIKMWWREFPEGQAIHMKRSVSEQSFINLNLYKYRAQNCSAVIRSVSQN